MANNAVLIVDDEKNIRLTLSQTIESPQMDVETAIDGEEALGKLQGKDFGLVLLDLKLPGMDGMDVLRWIRANRPGDPRPSSSPPPRHHRLGRRGHEARHSRLSSRSPSPPGTSANWCPGSWIGRPWMPRRPRVTPAASSWPKNASNQKRSTWRPSTSAGPCRSIPRARRRLISSGPWRKSRATASTPRRTTARPCRSTPPTKPAQDNLYRVTKARPGGEVLFTAESRKE